MSIIGTCNGCFDGVHKGHALFLGYCRALCDSLILGINSDEYILKRKGKLIMPLHDRIRYIQELGVVDNIIVFYEDTASNFIDKIKPHKHFASIEYKNGFVELPACIQNNVQIVWVPRFGTISSTSIREQS